MEFGILKRIFKKAILIFWCYLAGSAFFIVPHIYVIAQEEEDIEWLDEDNGEEIEDKEDTDENMEAEMGALQPENNTEGTKSESTPIDIDKEKTEGADSVSDTADEGADSVSDTADEGADSVSDIADESADSGTDEYEQSLYEAYVQYYSKMVSSEDWSAVVGGKDLYTVQQKDTLWDISKVLFGDSSYWPKLWSVNPTITNPHLIQPNDNLGFIPGTEGTPPSLSVIQGGLTQAEGDFKKPPPLPDFLKSKKINVPTSSGQKPVMQNIPSSLPHLYLSDKEEVAISDLELSFNQVKIPTVTVLHHYMSGEPITGRGVVSDKKDYGTWFHAGQRVILTMGDSVNPGQKMVVVQNKGKLYPALGVRGPFGYQVEVQGEVEVIGRVPDSFDLYEAKVTKSLNPVTIGAIVLDQNIIEFDYHITDNMGSAEAQIIGVPSKKTDNRTMASAYSLVYLNRGAGSDISVGQMYQVRANPYVRKMKYGYDIKVGELKIIYAEDRFATGLITEMSNPVYVGDYITSLTKGLSVQSGYDPLDDDDMEEEADGSGGVDEDDDMEEEAEGSGGIDEEDMEFWDLEKGFEDTFAKEKSEKSGDVGSTDKLSDEEDAFEAFE